MLVLTQLVGSYHPSNSKFKIWQQGQFTLRIEEYFVRDIKMEPIALSFGVMLAFIHRAIRLWLDGSASLSEKSKTPDNLVM